MKTINKKIPITITLVAISSVLIYLSLRYTKKIDPQSASLEQEYAQAIKKDIEEKLFIANLPIYTNNYSILYDSLNSGIVVIFKNSSDHVSGLKQRYENDIVDKLKQIGVNKETISKVSWEKVE
jgi:hypothetical protein